MNTPIPTTRPGIVKPATPQPVTLVSAAISQIGVTEDPVGSNWGYSVKQYLLSVGINFPASWCMAFVYWCVRKASTANGKENPLTKTGSVMAQWAASKHLRVAEPIPGDVFIMSFGKGLGHTGIVERVDQNFIYTIEGNTNDTGSREGIEVCRRQRTRKSILGYLRPSL